MPKSSQSWRVNAISIQVDIDTSATRFTIHTGGGPLAEMEGAPRASSKSTTLTTRELTDLISDLKEALDFTEKGPKGE